LLIASLSAPSCGPWHIGVTLNSIPNGIPNGICNGQKGGVTVRKGGVTVRKGGASSCKGGATSVTVRRSLFQTYVVVGAVENAALGDEGEAGLGVSNGGVDGGVGSVRSINTTRPIGMALVKNGRKYSQKSPPAPKKNRYLAFLRQLFSSATSANLSKQGEVLKV